MSNILAAAMVVAPLSILSALFVYLRAGAIIPPERRRVEGYTRSARRAAIAFLLGGLLLGYLAAGGYGWLRDFATSDAEWIMLWLGIGAAAGLSAAAAFVRIRAGATGLPEIITLNVAWGLAYGWLLPWSVQTFGTV